LNCIQGRGKKEGKEKPFTAPRKRLDFDSRASPAKVIFILKEVITFAPEYRYLLPGKGYKGYLPDLHRRR